jgi:hypothetical protein
MKSKKNWFDLIAYVCVHLIWSTLDALINQDRILSANGTPTFWFFLYPRKTNKQKKKVIITNTRGYSFTYHEFVLFFKKKSTSVRFAFIWFYSSSEIISFMIVRYQKKKKKNGGFFSCVLSRQLIIQQLCWIKSHKNV